MASSLLPKRTIIRRKKLCVTSNPQSNLRIFSWLRGPGLTPSAHQKLGSHSLLAALYLETNFGKVSMFNKSGATAPYVLASIACLALGSGGFLLGLVNATTLSLSEKGFYLTLLAFGLFAAISVQKNFRDKESGINVPGLYSALSYAAAALSLGLLGTGLVNAELALSEKGYYGMSFVLALFSAITLQKSLRDANAKPATHS